MGSLGNEHLKQRDQHRGKGPEQKRDFTSAGKEEQ